MRCGISLYLEIIGVYAVRCSSSNRLSPKYNPHDRFACAVWVFCLFPWYLSPLCCQLCYRGIPARLTGQIVKNCWGKCDNQILQAMRITMGRQAQPIPLALLWYFRPRFKLHCCAYAILYPLYSPVALYFALCRIFTPYPMHGYAPTAKINSRAILGACRYILI